MRWPKKLNFKICISLHDHCGVCIGVLGLTVCPKCSFVCHLLNYAHHWHVQKWTCGQEWAWCTKVFFCLKTNYAGSKPVLQRKNLVLKEWHTPTTWALSNSTAQNVFWLFWSMFDLKLFSIISMSIKNNKYVETYNIQMWFH